MSEAEKDELLRIIQAAAQLGKQPKTLRQWCWRRKIAFLKIGSGIYIRQSTVTQVIAEAERPAVNQKKRGPK